MSKIRWRCVGKSLVSEAKQRVLNHHRLTLTVGGS